MDLNLEMEGGVFEHRLSPDDVRAPLRYGDLSDGCVDSGVDDDDARDAHNLVGFVDLFYLWCVTHGRGETSMSRFELSATRLVAR
jgi:hypothetical protein